MIIYLGDLDEENVAPAINEIINQLPDEAFTRRSRDECGAVYYPDNRGIIVDLPDGNGLALYAGQVAGFVDDWLLDRGYEDILFSVTAGYGGVV